MHFTGSSLRSSQLLIMFEQNKTQKLLLDWRKYMSRGAAVIQTKADLQTTPPPSPAPHHIRLRLHVRFLLS